MQKIYDKLKGMTEQGLDGLFSRGASQKKLLDAVKYSLSAGGKRIRPVLLLEFCRISGGDVRAALPFALAVEMLHTYTLIHDDLPCMDDDDLRRGKPSNHKVFGEATAVLAGDALQAAAFESALGADLSDEAVRRGAYELSKVAGAYGVCGGQLLDLEGEGKSLLEDEILKINRLKTAELFKVSCRMGVIAAGGSESRIEAAEIYGENLGLAFQLTDDILDETGDEEQMGKPVGSDAQRDKSTLLSIYGYERCRELARQRTDTAISALRAGYDDIGMLGWLADNLIGRTG